MEFDEKFLNLSAQFSKEFYQKTIAEKKGNVVISPISIWTSISFLTFGSSGKTLEQMKNSLKFNEFSNEDLEENFQLLTENFGAVGLTMANKIYLMENYSIKPKFNEIAIKSFHSEVESINFEKQVEAAENINQWVESKTNNKIKDLIAPDSVDSDTRLILVNAIHFLGVWKHLFVAKYNYFGQFYLNEVDSVEVEYMRQKSHFSYGMFEDLDAAAVELPYKDSNVSMLLILPNSRTGLPALESKLNEINFNELLERMSSRKVELTIPKFKIEFDINLENSLRKMGMNVMFTNAAEFGNLLDPVETVKVSKVVHKAFISVDENGTEAGGATRSGVNKCSLPKFFHAESPFMFVLIEGSKLLFIGRKVM